MGELLDAGLDLGGLALCYVAIALLLLTSGIVSAVQAAVGSFTVPVIGWHPFGFLNGVFSAAQSGINDALQGAQDAAAKFQSGLLDSLTLAIGIPLLLALGVYDLFTLLLKHTLPALIGTGTKAANDTAAAVAARVTALERTVANDLGAAKDYADSAAAKALSDAKAYAGTNIAAAANSLEKEIKSVADATAAGIVAADLAAGGAITKAIHGAIDAADFVTSGAVTGDVLDAIKSSDAIDAAIRAAVPAVAGLTAADVSRLIAAGLPSVDTLAHEVEGLLPKTVAGAGETAADVAQQIAGAIAGDLAPGGSIAAAIAQAIPAALPGVPPVSVPSLGDLANTVAGLGAAVAGIEAIRFIGNETCRGKVSQICDTDANALSSLLAGAAAIGVAYNLRAVVDAANGIFTEAADLIKATA